jgi:hypothetical protein
MKMISLWSFCWFELVLYNPFHDFCRDIGNITDDIIQNWETFHYNPWHIDHNPIPPKDPPQYEDEDEYFLNV